MSAAMTIVQVYECPRCRKVYRSPIVLQCPPRCDHGHRSDPDAGDAGSGKGPRDMKLKDGEK